MTRRMTYADYIADITYRKFIGERREAEEGHCMKLSGVADGVLTGLLGRFRANVPGVDTFLLDASHNTATKLG